MFTFKRKLFIYLFIFFVVVAYSFVSPGGTLFTYLKKKSLVIGGGKVCRIRLSIESSLGRIRFSIESSLQRLLFMGNVWVIYSTERGKRLI